MEILEKNQKPGARMVDFHAHIRLEDDRFAMTEEEYDRIINKYFRKDGTLERFPIKAKERVALLRKIVGMLVPGEHYSERELNAILSAVSDDHVLIRRCLVDYGFVSRVRDGSAYWVEL
jgi:hypothetical protein